MHGPRHVLFALVAAFLATAVVVAGLRADPSVPTFPGSKQLGEWNTGHVTSITHTAGVVRGFGVRATDVVDITNAALNVNCVVGCSGSSAANPIPHVSSVTHIFGFVSLVNRAGTYITATSTSLDVNCTGGCSGGVNTPVNQSGLWTIQGAHQLGEWNLRHVTSITHIYGTVSLVNRAGGYATFTGTSLDVNCTAGCAGGGTTSHITSVTHVYGTVSLVNRAGSYASFTGTSLDVNLTNAPAVTQSGEWNVSHVSSTIHLAGSVTDQNNKAIRVIAADALNINHVTSMLHISGQVEIVGRPRGSTNWVDVEANAMMVNVTQAAHISGSLHIAGTIKGAQFHVTGLGTPGQTHGGVFTIQGVTGMIPVKVDQNTLPWTIAHMSAVVHVSVMNSERSRLGMHITDAVCLTCKARVDHYDVLVVQPHISGSLVAWRVAECGTTQATVVPTNANRRDLMIRNVGSRPVYVGYGTTGHVALTIANGYPLHAMSTTSANAVPFENHYTASQKELNLPNYNGPLRCIAPGASQLAVLEILR